MVMPHDRGIFATSNSFTWRNFWNIYCIKYKKYRIPLNQGSLWAADSRHWRVIIGNAALFTHILFSTTYAFYVFCYIISFNINTKELSRYIAKVVPVNVITDFKRSIFRIEKSECDINNVNYIWIFTSVFHVQTM